jgi:hypothetical protein
MKDVECHDVGDGRWLHRQAGSLVASFWITVVCFVATVVSYTWRRELSNGLGWPPGGRQRVGMGQDVDAKLEAARMAG